VLGLTIYSRYCTYLSLVLSYFFKHSRETKPLQNRSNSFMLIYSYSLSITTTTTKTTSSPLASAAGGGRLKLRLPPHHLVYALDHVVDVSGVQPAYRDASATHQVNVVVPDQFFALFSGQACEREHADLARDVAPVGRHRRALSLQPVSQLFPQVLHSSRHRFHLNVPLLEQCGVGKHLVHDERTVDGRIRVGISCNYFQPG